MFKLNHQTARISLRVGAVASVKLIENKLKTFGKVPCLSRLWREASLENIFDCFSHSCKIASLLFQTRFYLRSFYCSTFSVCVLFPSLARATARRCLLFGAHRCSTCTIIFFTTCQCRNSLYWKACLSSLRYWNTFSNTLNTRADGYLLKALASISDRRSSSQASSKVNMKTTDVDG